MSSFQPYYSIQGVTNCCNLVYFAVPCSVMNAFDFYEHSLKLALEMMIYHWDKPLWMVAARRVGLRSIATIFGFGRVKELDANLRAAKRVNYFLGRTEVLWLCHADYELVLSEKKVMHYLLSWHHIASVAKSQRVSWSCQRRQYSAVLEVLYESTVSEHRLCKKLNTFAAANFAARKRLMGENCRAGERRVAELSSFCLKFLAKNVKTAFSFPFTGCDSSVGGSTDDFGSPFWRVSKMDAERIGFICWISGLAGRANLCSAGWV